MLPSKITIDGLAVLFGLESAESLDERNTDYVWESGDFAAKYALEHGATEAESDAARETAEGEAQSAFPTAPLRMTSSAPRRGSNARTGTP